MAFWSPFSASAKVLIGASLVCSATAYSTSAAAAACQAGDPNCVLPVRDAPPPAPAAAAAPAFVEEGAGWGGWLLPLLAALAIAAAAFLILDDDDEEEIPVSP